MAEPGWYKDQTNPELARWHTGSEWTEHTIVRAEHTAPPPDPTVRLQAAFAPPSAPTAPASPLGGYQAPPAHPPQAPHQPPVQVVIQTNNGMAVAALVLGIVGVVFGLVPILFVIAWICGILGLIFGVVGRNRGKQTGQRKTMATWGLVLGVVALGLGILGVAIVDNAFNDVSKCLNSISVDGSSVDDACN